MSPTTIQEFLRAPTNLLKAFHLMPEDLVKAAKDVLHLKQNALGSRL